MPWSAWSCRAVLVPATHLEVRAGNAASYLSEERLLHLDKLPRLNHIQYLLKLIQEHHLRHTQQAQHRKDTHGWGQPSLCICRVLA